MERAELISCYNSIRPYINKTPVLTSTTMDSLSGSTLFFKCENFQKIGAFKYRGALNAISKIPKEQLSNGVVTHSSGNFAQALALAATKLGVKSYIVMPSTSPKVKMDAVKGYGGIIIECEPTNRAREATAKKIEIEKNARFVHSSNDIDVIAGQGTACFELLEDYPDIEVVITPVGGGGLLAGTCLYANCFGHNCTVYGGEPFEVDDAYRSLKSGTIQHNKTTNTIAEGLKTHLGDINFPILQKYVKEIIRVEETEIAEAMKLIWERMKIIVETSSAVALAAVLKNKEKFKGKKTGIILSGGNVDLSKLPF